MNGLRGTAGSEKGSGLAGMPSNGLTSPAIGPCGIGGGVTPAVCAAAPAGITSSASAEIATAAPRHVIWAEATEGMRIACQLSQGWKNGGNAGSKTPGAD